MLLGTDLDQIGSSSDSYPDQIQKRTILLCKFREPQMVAPVANVSTVPIRVTSLISIFDHFNVQITTSKGRPERFVHL